MSEKLLIGAAVAVLLIGAPAQASVISSISIDESVEGAAPTITLSPDLNPSLVNPTVTPVAGVVGEAWTIGFTLAGFFGASPNGINLLEMLSGPNSDTLFRSGTTETGTSVVFQYTLYSDDNQGNIAGTCGFCGFAVEDGTFQLVGDLSTTGNPDVLLFLKSEVDPVPEPATLALFGIGLAGRGLALARRKSRRNSP